MIGTHGFPSCLFGFLTRRTLNGGKRMGFLTMMRPTATLPGEGVNSGWILFAVENVRVLCSG